MKRTLLALLGGSILLTGCATDPYYNAAKTIYVAGKKVVIANWDRLPEGTKEKLKEIDAAATTYDASRKIIKPAIEEAKKEVAESNSTKETNTSSR
ncbi:hypothetical protein [Nitratiruptor sp. SB155-2]|uniref:hypothetical protein n=1 Tax=Nitratiruptor sp. (strain SB155-2) TaxID=387092 RepID=UPI0002D8A731|nr:hypothetical protein [Nitratiruptor sp. SB155-2]